MMDDQSRCYSIKSTATTAGLPRCVCSWKNCRAFQKAYREFGHPVLDGVVKMKFIRGDTASQPLKNSIDRTLKVSRERKMDWRPGKKGQEFVTYKIARHHFTELHILRYLNNSKMYRWTKFFTTAEANKFLFKLDSKESVRLSDDGEYYFQCPNVSKDYVKQQFNRMKQGDESEHEEGPEKNDLGAFFKQERDFSDHSGRMNGYTNNPNSADGEDMSSSRSAGDIIAIKERENERLRKDLEFCQAELKYYQEMVRQLQEDPEMKRRNIKNIPGGRNQSERNRERGPAALGDNGRNDWSDEEGTLDSSVQQGGYGGNPRRGGKPSSTSVASRASIVSASQSVRSLPREIELAEDEANNDDTSMEDTFDDRSYASRGSRASNKKQPYANPGYDDRRTQRSGSVETCEVKKQVIVDIYGERGTYAGSLSKATGMPHGKGRLEYAAGRWYEGDWKHGRWTGHGRLSNGDGDLYEGELRNDHKHGKGTMRFVDGRVFVGEYINGQMIEGKMTYQDGSNYEGSWVDGMRHGRGKCVFTDASVYEGEFTEGEFHGHGKMSWSDGGWYEGEWWSGDMQGFGKEMRPDGSMRHEGQWSKGQPLRNRS